MQIAGGMPEYERPAIVRHREMRPGVASRRRDPQCQSHQGGPRSGAYAGRHASTVGHPDCRDDWPPESPVPLAGHVPVLQPSAAPSGLRRPEQCNRRSAGTCWSRPRKSGAAALGTMPARRQAVMISGHVAAVRQRSHHESVANSARPGLPGIRARVQLQLWAVQSRSRCFGFRASERPLSHFCRPVPRTCVLGARVVFVFDLAAALRKAGRDGHSEAWREYGVSERCYERPARLFRPNARRLSAGPRVHPRNGSPATLKHRSSF